MSISIGEWKFVLEINMNEPYYLKRVFNISTIWPELYFINLERLQELL